MNEQNILTNLGIYKIKYSILDDLDLKKISSFHIDLNSILQILFKYNATIDTKYPFKFSIASAILNLVAHFRAYFVKNKWDVKIYMYYSDMGDKRLVKHIEDSIELVSIICKYIPNLYIITNDDVDIKLAMNYFIDKDDACIFTKNQILYQFISKHVYVLRPSRDNSYIVNKKNLYNKLTKSDNDYTISHELLTAILAFSGIDEYKGVKGMGLKKTLNLFQKAIDNRDIINEYYPEISSLLNDLPYEKSYTKEIITDTFSDIDIRSIKRQNTGNSYQKICDEFIVDKFAKKDLKELNTKYFTGFNSLMLQELLLEPKQSNDKNKIKW